MKLLYNGTLDKMHQGWVESAVNRGNNFIVEIYSSYNEISYEDKKKWEDENLIIYSSEATCNTSGEAYTHKSHSYSYMSISSNPRDGAFICFRSYQEKEAFIKQYKSHIRSENPFRQIIET